MVNYKIIKKGEFVLKNKKISKNNKTFNISINKPIIDNSIIKSYKEYNFHIKAKEVKNKKNDNKTK